MNVALILVAVLAGGFWFTWGDPGAASTGFRAAKQRAVRAAIERFVAIPKAAAGGEEVRRTGSAYL